jgi:methylmalonyl-CoA/ethylmalonyl-CoA epimerase
MMEKESGEIVQQSKILHIGIVVKNVDETIQYFSEKFGFGPFEIRYVDFPTATYYGKEAGYRGKRGIFHMGPIEIELIELIDGKTIHEDFLKGKGAGLHHIGFEVENLANSCKNSETAGFQITQSFVRADGSGFAYIDSDKIGGTIFELVQKPVEKK